MPAIKKVVRTIVILTVLSLAGYFFYSKVLRPPAQPAGVIAVSGRIEGDDAAVAAKTAGRIKEITVREGDRVKAGQVIATIDDEQIRAREAAAQSAVDQAEARLARARQQMPVLQQQLDQSRLNTEQARIDAE